jgi:hypothetical protein
MPHAVDPQFTVLALVAERLESAGIAYMITGSIALTFYGYPRMTRDLDLVIEVDVSDAERMHALFSDEFYCTADGIRDAIRQRRMFNLIHIAEVVKVDMVVRKDDPYRRAEFARRRESVVEGRRFWLVTPEDLLLSKLVWLKTSGFDQQRRDIEVLLTSVVGLDWSYVEHWAEGLGVADLLREVQA